MLDGRRGLDKGLVDVHAGIEIPKGKRINASLKCRNESCKTERRAKDCWKCSAFRLAGQSFFLRPARLKIARRFLGCDAKDMSIGEFYKEFEKIAGGHESPLGPQALEKVIRSSCRATRQ